MKGVKLPCFVIQNIADLHQPIPHHCMASLIADIILALDKYMEAQGKKSITPPEGNVYLDSIGLLPNYDRSGSELRKFCRNGFIPNARQPGGKGTNWFIHHSSIKTFPISSKLESILNSGKGEREVAAFLAKYPNILRWTVCITGGHSTWVLKEYPLSSKYKIDYAVVTCYSGKWEIHPIELEPHDDQVITKAGVPSKRLNGAIAQINDWKEYIAQNSTPFRQELSEWCIRKDILGESKSIKTPVNGTNQYLKSPDTYLEINYYIVIGNRKNISEEQRRRMNQIQFSSGLEMFTYGRFIDVARNFDRFHNGEHIFMTESLEKQ
jgi:hypothetical protein